MYVYIYIYMDTLNDLANPVPCRGGRPAEIAGAARGRLERGGAGRERARTGGFAARIKG